MTTFYLEIHPHGASVSNAQLKLEIDRIIADRIRKLDGFGLGSIDVHLDNGVVNLVGAAAPRARLSSGRRHRTSARCQQTDRSGCQSTSLREELAV
jgi:hypothetical protein